MLTDILNKEDTLIPVLIFLGLTFTVGVRTIGSVLKTSARERTRREIAAYIAEGSMTPEQGERIMRANNGDSGSCRS